MFKRIKEFFTVPLDIPSRDFEVESWWDEELKLWTSVFKDERANQVGCAGYGTSQKASVIDVHYQNDGVI